MSNGIYINRKGKFKKPNKQQYNISMAEYPEDCHVADLEQAKSNRTKFLRSVQGSTGWSKTNLARLLKSPENWKSVLSKNLFNVGFLNSKEYPNLSNTTEGIGADWVYLDFDNTAKCKDADGNWQTENLMSEDEGYITFETVQDILDKAELNYIIHTSTSHDKDGQEKIHVLIPTLCTIDSNELYRDYFLDVLKRFDGYACDKSVGNISRCKHGGHPDSIRVEVQLDKNDLYLDIPKRVRNSKKKQSKIVSYKNMSDIPDEAVDAYYKMAGTMYGFRRGAVRSSTVRFFRAGRDNHPDVYNVPYPESDIYDPYNIVENQPGGGWNNYKTPFVVDDFVRRQLADDIRGDLQDKLYTGIRGWYYSSCVGENKHQYVITNEGLGKSYCVMRLAIDGLKFIYAFHNKAGIAEKAARFKKEGVDYRIVLGGSDLLKEQEYDKLAIEYDKYMDAEEEPTFSNFLFRAVEKELITKLEANTLETAYAANNNQINEDAVILMTTVKLKIMHKADQAGMLANSKHVIFDEFTHGEWGSWVIERPKGVKNPKKWLQKTWNEGRGKFEFYDQGSMFKALESKNVLVLTTERRLAELYFSGSDYTELTMDNQSLEDFFFGVENEDVHFDKLLKADNVIYLLVKSTKKENLPGLLERFNNVNGLNIIGNGLKKSEIMALTHLSVKGLDHLANEDSLVVGTKKPENVVKEVFVNNREFFEEKYKEVVLESIARRGTAATDHKEYEEQLIRKSEKYIQDVLIETEASQSIGRNSGFRYNGKRCVVVLPMMHSKSFKMFGSDFHFNYVSENVSVVEYDSVTGKLAKVVNF